MAGVGAARGAQRLLVDGGGHQACDFAGQGQADAALYVGMTGGPGARIDASPGQVLGQPVPGLEHEEGGGWHGGGNLGRRVDDLDARVHAQHVGCPLQPPRVADDEKRRTGPGRVHGQLDDDLGAYAHGIAHGDGQGCGGDGGGFVHGHC